jgi:hypothetical protein
VQSKGAAGLGSGPLAAGAAETVAGLAAGAVAEARRRRRRRLLQQLGGTDHEEGQRQPADHGAGQKVAGTPI